jgi:ADP-ribosylglycohydrolase
MERLGCDNAAKALAGAIYAALVSQEDFDRAMVVSVNHSGRSSAVGAIAGAILGLRMGEEALPEFYLESLEPVEILLEMADDLYTGCPMEQGNKLFDLDWDYKYLHGGQ